MKLPRFNYHRPSTVAQAVALLAERGPDAAALAGGQSLVPSLALRDRRPAEIVDLNGIEDLVGVESSDGVLSIGAMTRQRVVELDETIALLCPLLAAAIGRTGHVSVRNRGTIGGAIAHANPAAEIPTAALALDAQVLVVGQGGEHAVPMGELLSDPFTTTLRAGELVTALRIPLPTVHTGYGFREVSHPVGSQPVVCVAAAVRLRRDGLVRNARVAVSGRGAPPVLVDVTASLTDGNAPDLIAGAMRFVAEAAEGHGPGPEYCRAAARKLARAALAEATGGRYGEES